MKKLARSAEEPSLAVTFAHFLLGVALALRALL